MSTSSSTSRTRSASARRFTLRTLSGNARFSNTVMCGQTAYDWKTMPRLRCSAGTSILRSASKNVSAPIAMRPSFGVWNPASDISVVDFPQPLGPRSVKSSPSATVNPTWSSARWSPKSRTRPSTWISGIVNSCHPDLEQLRADRQRGHRPDRALDELRQHRRAHHLGPRPDEKHRRVVVVQDLDEHEHERGEDRRPQQRQDDAAARAPPPRAGGAARAVELLADPRQRRVHHDVRERQVADAEREHDPPDRVPE